jgi:pyroglutamyl-peptidase
MNSRLFVTGFGPFGTVTANPSQLLAESYDGPKQILDVSFAAVDDFVREIDQSSFDTLLLIGVASGRDRLTPEFFARNSIGKTKDVCGESRFGEIDANQPLLLEGTLWRSDQVAEWTMDMPVRASFDAGNYLCNYVYFRALENLPSKHVGFLHVPPVEKVSFEEQKATLKRIIADLG